MVLSKREASPLFCLQEGRARGWEYDIYLLLVFWFFLQNLLHESVSYVFINVCIIIGYHA